MKIAVGMSGGVDSSVSALILKEMGYDVVGIFMKNWEDDEDDPCPAKQDYEDALAVAEKIGIPLYAFNFSQEYWDRVFTLFLDDLKAGYTPNPDILCNREIKFSVLFDKAKSLGVEKIATGHYARVTENNELSRGIDQGKDQSYFLYTLKDHILENVLFPIGALEKSLVREKAKKAGLDVATKRDSTGICFIGKRNFKEFLSKYMPPTKGVFQTPEGEVVGEHDGAWYYTIGQRKGMGIGGAGDAWFVADKDIKTHTVTVVQGENHPLLFSNELVATDITWITRPPSLPFKCSAKIRYRQSDQLCTIYAAPNDTIKVKFDTPQRAVTPCQSVVFYKENICLGGGVII